MSTTSLALPMVVLAGLFAGSETGIYRLSRLRLRLRAEKGHWFSSLLAKTMRDSSSLLLSLLLGTNLSHYVVTSLITAAFLDVVASEHVAELYTTLLTAPVLFIFSELIPKNIFLYRADMLTPAVAPLLYVSHKLFTWCGAVPLLRLASSLCARLIGSPVSSKAMIRSSQSHQVRAILHDTREEGLLSPVQTEMFDRIVNIPRLQLNTVMVPLAHVRSLDIGSGRTALLSELRRQALTRLLVWQDERMNIVGYVNVYDALGSDEGFTGLAKFVMPIRSLEADTSIIDAVDVMRRDQLKIILVTRRRGKREVPLGIVTMKDLVEELMGELAEW